MLTEYSALIAVPVFVFAGERLEPRWCFACCARLTALWLHCRESTGRITLNGIPPDMDTLVRNTVTQVFVQAFVDLVRACRASTAGALCG